MIGCSLSLSFSLPNVETKKDLLTILFLSLFSLSFFLSPYILYYIIIIKKLIKIKKWWRAGGRSHRPSGFVGDKMNRRPPPRASVLGGANAGFPVIYLIHHLCFKVWLVNHLLGDRCAISSQAEILRPRECPLGSLTQ
jgi:hypothetical protein